MKNKGFIPIILIVIGTVLIGTTAILGVIYKDRITASVIGVFKKPWIKIENQELKEQKPQTALSSKETKESIEETGTNTASKQKDSSLTELSQSQNQPQQLNGNQNQSSLQPNSQSQSAPTPALTPIPAPVPISTPTTDLCNNIEGAQSYVPVGFIAESNGNCVTIPQSPALTPASAPTPTPTPTSSPTPTPTLTPTLTALQPESHCKSEPQFQSQPQPESQSQPQSQTRPEQGKNIEVPTDYPTIQTAISEADPGDIIIVKDGTYIENIIASKSITIKSENGANSTIIQAMDSNKHVFHIKAGYVEIKGFTIEGNSRKRAGIQMESDNCIVSDNIIHNSQGIYLSHANNNDLINNVVSDNGSGISVFFSNNNTLTNNTINENNSFAGNDAFGIRLYSSSNNTLTGNTMLNNQFNFSSECGEINKPCKNNVDTSNTVNGKLIYYIRNAENKVYDSSMNIGAFYCIDCNKITVKDLILTKNGTGIYFLNTYNSKIENVTVSGNRNGIDLYSSNYNSIENSKSTNNENSGINLLFSHKNTIRSNSITENTSISGGHGIYVGNSTYNAIENNVVNSSLKQSGIVFNSSSNCNMITNNEIMSNASGGIVISYSSSYNTVTNNNIASNKILGGVYIYYGFSGDSTGYNRIYYNNFIDNTCSVKKTGQAYSEGSTNSWNNDYPSGGNYWSDYGGVDLYSGSGQSQSGSDGMGDTPYIFNGGQDNYPLMEKQ